MDENPDQIIDHIENQRSQLGANLNELESRVRRTTDWRAHFDNNPMLMLGAALGGGLVLGAVVAGARSSRSNSSSYTSSRHFSSSGEASSSYSATATQRHKASETLDNIKGALIAFATAKAKEFLNDAIPGFDGFLRDSESKSSTVRGSESHSPSSGRDQYSSYSQQGYGQTPGEYGRQGYGGQPSADDQRTSRSGQGANYGQDDLRAGRHTGEYENQFNRP